MSQDCSAGHWMENLILAVDYGLPGNEVNLGTTFEAGGVSLWIPLLINTSIISFYLLVDKMCICMYMYIIVNIVSS